MVNVSPLFKNSLRAIWLFLAWAIMLVYVASMTPFAFAWVKMQYYDSISMTEVAERVTRAEKAGYVLEALQVIKAQSRDKDEQVMAVFEPLAPTLSPPIYLEFARRTWKKDMARAAFWVSLGRFRMRYDAARCMEKPVMALSLHLAQQMVPPQVKTYLETDVSHIKISLQQTLDWDEAHPPQNDPRYICTYAKKLGLVQTNTLQPVFDWPFIYRLLRQAEVDFIHEDPALPAS